METPNRWAGLLLAALGIFATDATAQVQIRSRAAQITVTGRVQLQWNTTSVDGPISNEFLIRRARLTAEVKVNDLISGKVQPDFGEGELDLKDAYMRLSFAPGFRATLGQFKRPFDLFELTSSTQILVVERAGGIRGVDTCSGIDGLCSFSRFSEKLEYSDRDIGVMLDGNPNGSRVTYMLSVTNGTGSNAADENGAKSFTGRIEFEAREDLVVGGNIGVHDYLDETGAENDYAFAFGGDVELGNYSEGLHVQGGFVAGDNWQNLDASGSPSTFFSAQGIVAYKIPVQTSRFVEAVEPLGRISWGDPDTDADDDAGILLTPGFVAHFSGRNKIAANLDIWSPSQGDTEFSLKVQSYLHF